MHAFSIWNLEYLTFAFFFMQFAELIELLVVQFAYNRNIFI